MIDDDDDVNNEFIEIIEWNLLHFDWASFAQ